MAQKSYQNFEENLAFCLKNDVRNLANFNASSGKSENFHFDGLLLQKVVMFELKKYRGVVLLKMTFGFKLFWFGLSAACLKLSKFLMWFLKPGASFCLNFASFCNVLAKA